MFYQAVEEYVLHSHQRKLAKDLDLKRQMRGLSKSTAFAEFLLIDIAGRLRNLACRSELAANSLRECGAH